MRLTLIVFRCRLVNRGISKEQMQFLEYLIWKSRDVRSDFAKKAIIWLLRKSEFLTKPVCVSLPSCQGGKDAAFSVHDMPSSNGTTHLNEALGLAGIDFTISECGGYHPDRPAPDGNDYYTVWVGKGDYERSAQLLEPDYAEIEAVKLDSPYKW